MKRVGVTGAAGFIGSHLCERLVKEGCEVVGVDDLSYGSVANLQPILGNPKFTFEVLDCTRRRSLRAAFDGCDAIAHLAAKKIPRFGGVVSTLETNVAGANVACGVALQLGADLVITSTSDVYGNASRRSTRKGRSCSARRRRSAGRTRSRRCTTSTSRSRSRRSAASR